MKISVATAAEQPMRKGERVDVFIPEGKEALEFACNMWDYDLQGMGYELNALGTDYIYTEMESFRLADLFGKPALLPMSD